jgi:GT2 family glycosyltransferase
LNISWASGACFLVRKSAFTQIGGFDDDFFAHMEEIDLCWRLINNNFKITYVHESTVYHVGGGTLSHESSFKTYLNFRNGLYLLLKNIPYQQLRKKLIIRIFLDWFNALYYLIQGKWKQSLAILKAHKKVLKTKSLFLAKRKDALEKKEILQSYSIVWKYFIKGEKIYRKPKNNS